WYPDLFRALGQSHAVLTWIQFALGSALLLVPTTLMGGTLAVLSQALAGPESRLGRLVGGLYAVNTCGAVMGAALAGYLPRSWRSFWASQGGAPSMPGAGGCVSRRRWPSARCRPGSPCSSFPSS